MSYFIKENKIKGYGGVEKTEKELIISRVIGASIVGLFAFIILIECLLSIHTVDAGEVGIVKRFGEVTRVQESGLAFTIPFVETMTEMEIRVQKEEQTASAATHDLQDVSAKLAVNYALDNNTALKVYKELGVDYKNRVVFPAIQETFKVVSAKYTASELITERPVVKAQVVSEITTRLNKYGIRVVDVNLTDFKFSDAFNDAIEAVQIANQNIAKARQELETARIEAEKVIVAAEAKAKANDLQKVTLTPELLQKMMIEKWNGVLPTTQAGDSTILSLPIK